MTDVLFVASTVAFFALCVGYVRACNRIITPESERVDKAHRESAASSR